MAGEPLGAVALMGPQQLQPTPLVSSPFPRGSPVAAPPPGSALSAPHQVWRGGPEQEGRRFRGSRRNHGERFWNPASPQAFRTGPGLFLSARVRLVRGRTSIFLAPPGPWGWLQPPLERQSGFLSPGGAGPHLPPTLPSLPWGPGGGPPQDQRSVPASSPRTLPPTLVMSSDCWRPRRTEQQGRSPEEVTCAVCLDYLHEPVTIDCGHNFCRACITRCWDEMGRRFPCPQCRARSPKRKLRPNCQLGPWPGARPAPGRGAGR
uniref:RING-type domain-containing protein n=1 Tax=Sarcophilus harrisii TaxID=9305 RepID=A0A7N4NWM6_SARHA